VLAPVLVLVEVAAPVVLLLELPPPPQPARSDAIRTAVTVGTAMTRRIASFPRVASVAGR